MIAQQIQAREIVSFDDLKVLAGASGPCISVVLGIPNPLELRARLKNMLRTLQKEIEGRVPDGSGLLEPIQNLALTMETSREWANTLVILRSPDLFQYYWLRADIKDLIDIGDRFQVRPLFEIAAIEQCFHLLVLSQKEVRLRHITPHRVEEVDLQGRTPLSFTEFLNTRQPDHRLENRSTNGPSVGSMKGAPFGSGTDREREDESLRHFFSRVNQAVREIVRGREPLVLAAVDHDAALYQQVNTYSRVIPGAVYGANFSGPELLQRAWDAVRHSKPDSLEKALADFERHSNLKQVTTHPREAVKSAFEGRVADLFFTSSAQLTGVCDESTHRVRAGKGEDLVNAAALRTVLHGGRAFQLESNDMPVRADFVAALRF